MKQEPLIRPGGIEAGRARDLEAGLALSGGGFRATLFHLGSLCRLNEFGWLRKLQRITSVSGGSIAAGYLAYRWKELQFDGNGCAGNFDDLIVKPLRSFCFRNIQGPAILRGALSSAGASKSLAGIFNKMLFHQATLQDLPKDDEGPRFIIYASSLHTGVSVRFSQPYIADYRVGQILRPTTRLADAVAASCSFPPFFGPFCLKTDPRDWTESTPRNEAIEKRVIDGAYRKGLRLVDGGVYDNLGLEAIWERCKTVLVSDAGAPYRELPSNTWWQFSRTALMMRVLRTIDRQNRALRKRFLIRDFETGAMQGAYWGIGTEISDYGLPCDGRAPAICADSDVTRSLSQMRTSLACFKEWEQSQLINWGYALADAAMRRHVLPQSTQPGRLPIAQEPL